MNSSPERRPLNLLFVMMQMAMGGSERVVYNLITGLDRRVFSPSVAWFHGDAPLPEFQDLGIPLHHVPKRGRVDWGAMRRLRRLVRERQIDVINAHHFMPFVYAFHAARAEGAGLVYTEHSEADVAAVGGKWRPIGRWMLGASGIAIGITSRVTEALQARFSLPPGVARTVENGVDVERFRQDPDRRRSARAELGFAESDVVFGHVANYRHNKNHLFLLRAFRDLRRTDERVRLVLAGQGFPSDPENSEPDVAAFIAAHGLSGSVRMLGYRPDVRDALAALDVVCLVSRKEGRPLSLVEAMACGLPVVGTDIEGLRGLVVPEDNGLLVPVDDVPALTGALARLAADQTLRSRFGAASRGTACSTYSLARCVRETQGLFLSAAGGRAARGHLGGAREARS